MNKKSKLIISSLTILGMLITTITPVFGVSEVSSEASAGTSLGTIVGVSTGSSIEVGTGSSIVVGTGSSIGVMDMNSVILATKSGNTSLSEYDKKIEISNAAIADAVKIPDDETGYKQ